MKIQINIDLQPQNTAEVDRLTRLVNGIDAILNALEVEVEKYRQRLERVEEMTTRFESSQKED